MAKKKDDMDFGAEFENWESDLNDLNFDDDVSTSTDSNRSPVTKVRQGITAGLKSTTTSVGPKLASKIGTQMPMTSNLVGEAMQFSSDAKALKDNFTREIQPTINTLKKAGRTLAPKFKGYLPNSLQLKLDKFLQEAERSKTVSVEDSRNEAIDNQLALIFAAQEKREQKVLEEEKTDKFVDRTISATRHQELSKVVDAIRVAAEFQKEYTSTIGTAYLKKSLELKFKHLFVAQDTLASVQGMAKVMEEKLEIIRHNTALPDTQKQLLTESYKEVAKAALAQRFNSKLSGWGGQILSNVKEQILNPVKEGLGMAAFGADMYSTMSEMEDSFGDGPNGAQKVGGIAGGIASNFLVKKVAGKLFGNGVGRGLISPYAQNSENFMENLKAKLMLKAQHAGDNAEEGTFKKFALGLLSPNLRRGGGMIKDDLSDPFEPASFDKATRTSIVEIIPGFLGKILQMTTKMATGKDSEELTYSYDKRDFVSASEFRSDVLERAFGTKEERGETLGRAVGAMRGSFAHHSDDFASFDSAVDDIKKVLVNAASSNNLIYPGWIKAYVDDSPVDSSEYRKYIKDIFKDIDDPKTVARVLVSTLYLNDREINRQAQSEVDRYVIGMMTKDQYLSVLPNYFAKTGQGRFLGDLAQADDGGFKINNDFVRQQRLDGTSESFDTGVNATAKRTKNYLAKDYKDKQESHPLVRQYLEWISGNALNRRFDSLDGRQFNSEFDSFFRDMYNANMTPSEMEDFLSQAGGPPALGSAPKLIDSQAVNVRAPSVKRTKTKDGGGGKQTIISGTEIVIPVHLKSSDVKLSEPTTPAIGPKTTTVSGSLEQITQTHAERQYPVPDLLQKLVTTSSEMNEKLLSLISNTTGTIKGLYHKGKELTKSYWQRIQRISILDSVTRTRERLSGAAGSVGNWLFEGATTIGAGALGAAGAVAGVPGGIWKGLKGWKDNLKEQGGLMEAARGRMARTKARLGEMKDTIKNKFDLKFVDVYERNKVEVGKPLITAKQQRKGVVFSDGKPVLSSFNITMPVLDPETNETLISQENIDAGLVDVKNRPLKVKIFGKGGSLRSKIGGLFGIKGKMDSLKEMLTNDKGVIGLINTVTKGIFGAGGWLGRGIGKGVSTLFNKVTGREGIEVRRQDLKDMVGDKLDLIYQYLKQRFGESKGPNSDLFPDEDGKRDGQHQEYMKKQADQALELEKERNEKELETLESIDETTKANLALDAETAKLQAKEQGGGIMSSIMDMLGGTKYGKWAKNLFGGGVGAGIGGAIRGFGGKMLGGMAARFGLQAGATALLGSGAGAVTGAVGAGAAGSAAAGAGLAATTAAGGAAGVGGIAAMLASNPIGWAVAGALGVGVAAYAGYKWLNPSGDDLLKQRAEYYGVDLEKSTGFFSSSYSKVVMELEEITAEILQGKERAFNDEDLVYWAERFEFDPKDKEQVKYFSTWYRQRFYPTFRIFLDLVMKSGGTYEGIEDLTTEQREAISIEFQKQVGGNVTQYKDIVPTMEGFKKFYKIYVAEKEKMKRGEPVSEGDKAAIADAAKSDNDVTSRADKYGLDKAAVIAARKASWESDTASPTDKDVVSPQDKKTAWEQMTGGFGGPSTGDQKPVVPVDITGYTPEFPKTGELGALSAKYESSSLGSMAIGYDGTGGTSYGTYQIASKSGTFMEFLHWLKRQGPDGAEVAERLYRAGPSDTGSKTGAVPNEWRTLVKEGKMKDFEHQFIKATHYDKAFAGLADPVMRAMIESSKALQDVLWSTAVQHGAGGAKRIFNSAWASLQEKSPEAFIKAIYGLRGNNFPSSTQAVQQSVKKRFGQEAATAIAMLNREKSAPEDTAVASSAGGADVAGLAAAESSSSTSATTAVAQGPVIKNSMDTGTDMSPAAISNGPTAAVTTASTAATPIGAPATSAPSVPSSGGDESVNQLVRLNAGLDQVNMTLQAILLGQGVLNDINNGIQSGFSAAGKTVPETKQAVEQIPGSRPAGPKLHTAKAMNNIPSSISVNRASARSI